MNRLEAYDAELRRAGIPRRRRRRILTELADHLDCDPAARLGEPADLARQFANELGTAFARRAAFASFLALVPLGFLFSLTFAFAGIYSTDVPTGVTLALVVGVQLALVGGILALVRTWRLRDALTIPAAEAGVLIRRGVLGLAGGAMTVVALGLLVSGRYPGVHWSHPALGWTTAGVGAACIAAGMFVVVRSARLRPVADGAAGDVSSDLGLHVDPWRLAVWIAGGVALCIAAAGVVQADPIDGLVRGVGDGLLCLTGFAVLGRPLGLRT